MARICVFCKEDVPYGPNWLAYNNSICVRFAHINCGGGAKYKPTDGEDDEAFKMLVDHLNAIDLLADKRARETKIIGQHELILDDKRLCEMFLNAVSDRLFAEKENAAQLRKMAKRIA